MCVIVFFPETVFYLLTQRTKSFIFHYNKDLIGRGFKIQGVATAAQNKANLFCGINCGFSDMQIQIICKERIELYTQKTTLCK